MSGNMSVLLSIVIPIHNTKEQYLRGCLGAFVEHRDPRIEVILVDDGSESTTCAILDDVVQHFQCQYQVLHQKCMGPNAARNAGLQHARGEYTYFIDSDDALNWNALQSVLRYLEGCSTDVVLVGVEVVSSNEAKQDLTYGDHVMKNCDARTIVASAGPLWRQIQRTSMFAEYGIPLYDEIMLGEDMASVVPILTHAKTIDSLPFLVYSHFNREQSIVGTMSLSRTKDILKAFDHLIDLGCYNDYFHEAVLALAIRHVLFFGITNIVTCKHFTRSDVHQFYHFMDTRFPDWEKCKFGNNDIGGKISYRLITKRHWFIFAFLFRLRNYLKKIK